MQPEASDAQLSFAFELADLAATIAMARFRAADLVVQEKEDGSPVTDADRAVEHALRERIAQTRPEHGVLGEELGASGAEEWRWYLDPIDGTADFVAGGDTWKILIALVRDGRAELGVVASPVLGSRWWAVRGQGAFRDGRRLHVSTVARLADARVADDWRGTLQRGVADHPLARLAARSGSVFPYRGHNFLSVAAGEIDVAVSAAGAAWDYAPMQVLIEEAGGGFTDLDGRPRIDSGNALASNGLLHAQALRATAG